MNVQPPHVCSDTVNASLHCPQSAFYKDPIFTSFLIFVVSVFVYTKFYASQHQWSQVKLIYFLKTSTLQFKILEP